MYRKDVVQINLAASLMPLVLLFVTALFLHVGNSAVPLAARKSDEEITRALEGLTQEASILKPELKKALVRYCFLEGEARKEATHARAWKEWQNPVIGKSIKKHLKALRQRQDFALGTPLRHASGQVETLVTQSDRQLKVWFMEEKGQWKISGIVALSYPEKLQ